MTTKEKILNTALKLFVEKGIDKTSTNLIAKESGVASGTVFVHFKSKQEIVDTLYLNSKQKLFEGVKDSFDVNLDIKSNYYNLSRSFINYFLQNPLDYDFQKLIKKGIDVSLEVMREGDGHFAYMHESTKKAIAEGSLKQIDAGLIFMLTWNSLLTIVDFCRLQGLASVPEQYLDLIWEQVRSS